MTSNKIRVFIKVRPLINREKNENAEKMWQICGNSLKSTDKQYEMSFDNIHDENKSTEDLFEELAKPIVISALDGINGTIFAYGQTSSGKTYTMMGSEDNPGIIPRTVHEIFEQIEKKENRTFLVRYGYIEIYNEKIFDLLTENKTECTKFFEQPTGELTVNQKEVIASSEEQILQSYETGNKLRRVGDTNMNEHSSRSHTIFRITIESREVDKSCEDSPVQVSSLNLVDLAGSERANQTKAEGERLKEGGHINKSLLALGNVIRILSDTNAAHYINYRDSKLTRILSASLGGNAMTSIICTVTPASLDETFSTLVFAQNAKEIKNKPQVNKIMSDSAIMRRMEREIQTLKEQLEQEKLRNNEKDKKEHLVKQLMDKIEQREGQFLQSHHVTSACGIGIARRRTWCSSMDPPPVVVKPVQNDLKVPVPPFFCMTLEKQQFKEEDNLEDELFQPADDINFDRTLSPEGRTTDALSSMISTPRAMRQLRDEEKSSPNVNNFDSISELRNRVKYLEEELQEQNDFKKVENIINEDHHLKQQLERANTKIALLELKIEELEYHLTTKTSEVLVKEAHADRTKALKDKDLAESMLVSAQFEYEQFKAITKKREAELIETLDEARKGENEISQLKEKLRKAEAHVLVLSSQTQQINSDPLLDVVNLTDKIMQLENELKTVADDREKLRLKLDESKNLKDEYDQISTQLMDAIQENENLSKKVEELETMNRCQQQNLMDCSLENGFSENTDNALLDYNNDDDVPSFIQLHEQDLHKLPTITENIDEVQLSELTMQLEERSSELFELQALIDSQSEQLSEKSLKITELEMLNEQLMNQVKELEEKLSSQAAEMSSEIADLKEGLGKVMTLGMENDRLKKVEKEHLKMVNDLCPRLEIMQETAEKLKAANILIDEQAQKISELAANENISKIKIGEFEAEVAQNEENLLKIQTENDTLFNENNSLKLKVKESSHYKEINLDLDLRVHELQDQLEDLQRQFDEQRKEIETSSSSTNTTEEFESIALSADQEFAELRQKLQCREDELQALGSQLKIMQDAEVSAQQKATDAIEKLLKVEKEFKQSQTDTRELEVLKMKIDDLQSQLITKTESIEILEMLVKDKNQEINDMQQNVDLEKDHKEIENLTRQLAEKDEENLALIGKNEELHRDFNSQINALTLEINNFKTQHMTVQQEMEANEERIKSMQQQLSKMDTELKSVNAKYSVSEEELKGMSKLLKERNDECEEIKTRLRRRSCDNDKKIQALETEKNKLLHQIGAIEAERSHNEQDLRQLRSDHLVVMEQKLPKLHAEIEELKESFMTSQTLIQRLELELEKSKNSSTDSQFSSMLKINEDLKTENESLTKKVSQLTTESRTTIDELKSENSKLLVEINDLKTITRKSASPETRGSNRKSTDLYASQNQQMLLEVRATPTRILERNFERKNRRQGTHDERRRLSSWEKFTDAGIQTEAVSEICACSDLTQKVKELQIEVRQKECKISTMKRFADHNPLKLDVDEQKRLLAKEQRSHNQTKLSLDLLTRTVAELEAKSEILKKNREVSKDVVSQYSQTSDSNYVDKAEYDRIDNKCNEMKTLCRQLQERLKEIETVDKENVGKNSMKSSEQSRVTENENFLLKKKLQEIEEKSNNNQTEDVIKTEIEKLKADFKMLQGKYDMTRRLCNLRNDDIFKLKDELASKDTALSKLTEKYSTVKQVCEMRLDKLNVLRQRLGETPQE